MCRLMQICTTVERVHTARTHTGERAVRTLSLSLTLPSPFELLPRGKLAAFCAWLIAFAMFEICTTVLQNALKCTPFARLPTLASTEGRRQCCQTAIKFNQFNQAPRHTHTRTHRAYAPCGSCLCGVSRVNFNTLRT